MKVDNLNITKSIQNLEVLLEQEKDISPALRAAFEVMILIVNLLVNKLGLNSRNSSKPPSQDPNRKKDPKKGKEKRKPGGQKGHKGRTLEKVENPDEVIPISIDKRTLPKGQYTEKGYGVRQVIDILISRHVTEYRAQVLTDQNGNEFTASFPNGVDNPVQYGHQIKAQSVYLSMFQLIPYERVTDFFEEQVGIPVSKGTIVNFNQKAFDLLEVYDAFVKRKLIGSSVVHADETGINVGGKRIWLHSASNEQWTHFYPHGKRGADAISEIGIIPHFNGILVHDHWKPYFTYQCTHALCNAHHLRELERAWEQDNQQWAKAMQELLLEMNKEVELKGGKVSQLKAALFEKKYDQILAQAQQECPLPEPPKEKKRGRVKKGKSRNLLERLIEFKDETLRFLHKTEVPFTNNQGENDIRMTKVQQKISGCFRSIDGAKIFCRIRGFITTCRKNGVSASDALILLFNGDLPSFIKGDPAWPPE